LSCEDKSEDDPNIVNCSNMISGIIQLDSDLLIESMVELTKDLEPVPSDSDSYGHKINLELLSERISGNCEDIISSIICYACIYTYPPQSEILVQTDSSGTQVFRVLDIRTSEDEILSFVRIHKYYGN